MQLLGVTLWDGLEERGVCDLTWNGDSLERVAPSDRSESRGLAVIPGLIDTHVHILFGPAGVKTADPTMWRLTTPRSEQTLHGSAHAIGALQGGVTTLRDMAGGRAQFALSRALRDRVVKGPRLLVHGMVGMTAGHNDMFTPPSIRHRSNVADGATACRTLVRQHARAGAHGIKIATSGGVLSLSGDALGWRNYTDEEIAAIVDEAHALDLPVGAHAHTERGVQVALDHGVDSIEHGSMITEPQAREAASRGVTIAPTLSLHDMVLNHSSSLTPDQRQKASEVVSKRTVCLRAAAEAGVEFVLGTDADGVYTPFDGAMAEMRLMESTLGLTPEQVLISATSRAARAIRMEGLLGKLTAGYAADFVVLKGAPWRVISDLRQENIVAVVSHGEVVVGRLPDD
ncbi:MAG: amidohydrolase family protein [Candidatus Dormiibacterota bacterium]